PAAAAPDDSAAAAARRYAEAMRRVLARRGPPAPLVLPEWIRQLPADPELSPAQVDSCVVILTRTLRRLVQERTNGRTDYFIVDLANGAGTRRAQARAFLLLLGAGYAEQLADPHSGEAERLARAAARAGVDPASATDLVQEICRRWARLYEGDQVSTTRELVRDGRRQAGLSSDQAEALLRVLFGND
ncbi:MAG: hypothetical protein ABIL09_16705, partial [Gemmatimonadota bacterium]